MLPSIIVHPPTVSPVLGSAELNMMSAACAISFISLIPQRNARALRRFNRSSDAIPACDVDGGCDDDE